MEVVHIRAGILRNLLKGTLSIGLTYLRSHISGAQPSRLLRPSRQALYRFQHHCETTRKGADAHIAERKHLWRLLPQHVERRPRHDVDGARLISGDRRSAARPPQEEVHLAQDGACAKDSEFGV